jgi:hypothetical protein
MEPFSILLPMVKTIWESYASQLNSKQRWLIVQYVRALQKKAAPAATTTSSGSSSR